MKQDKKWSYKRIVDRQKELWKQYDETHDSIYLIEDDCICHFFECEGFKRYEAIAQFCEEQHIKRVIDIGCAFAHQSEVFLQSKIDYVGVNDSPGHFWNEDTFQYVVGSYPCRLPVQKGDLGISVLCLTWNCYLYGEKEQTLRGQCEALQKDFDHCLIYVQPSHLDVLSGYFKHTEKVDGNLYYFSN